MGRGEYEFLSHKRPNGWTGQKSIVNSTGWQVVASAAIRGWFGDDCAGGDIGDVSVAVHVGGRDESVSLRVFPRSDAGVSLHAADDSEICVEDFGAAAGSRGYSD